MKMPLIPPENNIILARFMLQKIDRTLGLASDFIEHNGEILISCSLVHALVGIRKHNTINVVVKINNVSYEQLTVRIAELITAESSQWLRGNDVEPRLAKARERIQQQVGDMLLMIAK
jgi:hypothetical protein